MDSVAELFVRVMDMNLERLKVWAWGWDSVYDLKIGPAVMWDRTRRIPN